MTPLPRVVVIGGQTASGKSALALRLACDAGDGLVGEIVAADSRQVYAGLRVAAAGPDDEELARAPHHLFDGWDPATTTGSAGAFVAAADGAIADIVARGRRAIVVGGTGLYLRGLRLGLDEAEPTSPAVRARLQAELATHGLAFLVDELRRRDPGLDARGLDLKNPVRVMRALEILDAGGRLDDRDLEALLRRPPRPLVADAAWWLVAPPTGQVELAIATRARRMFERGIVEEAVALAARVPPDHALLHTIGTHEALAVAHGTLDVAQAIDAITLRTRQYARRQRTWFKREAWWQPIVDPAAQPV